MNNHQERSHSRLRRSETVPREEERPKRAERAFHEKGEISDSSTYRRAVNIRLGIYKLGLHAQELGDIEGDRKQVNSSWVSYKISSQTTSYYIHHKMQI